MQRQKLSGAQYRKLKAEKLDQLNRQHDSLTKFFKPTTSGMVTPVATCASNDNESQMNNNLEQDEIAGSSLPLPNVDATATQFDTATADDNIRIERNTATGGDNNHEDPALWPSISDVTRIQIVKKGPIQVSMEKFPADISGRRFTSKYYTRKLVNGEVVRRLWLVYSKSKNIIFCFCCKLFASASFSLATNGSSDWKNVSYNFKSRKFSLSH